MKNDRPYNAHDLSILRSMKAPIEDDDFHAMYLVQYDVWCRGKHANAEMQQSTLHRMICDWEAAHASAPPVPVKDVQPKKQKAVA